ncbi:S-adenosyl-L-methionine-dependent methyltransferase [Crucibulum laeve]|uniref:S-adenosyl-L-methionine-dependent methyltransferase n=1 Tax=Crucibulum laeve TaxID=68775 RepID=A0A5C3M1R1_9AGAR|nr:S-adenosyl-L-methionine-dependent methyltransferase [Crucibulum laeve]
MGRASNTYMLPESAFTSPAELERLDKVNTALTVFFNGKLSFAPIEDTQPRRILELGCGSGAWAIDAASNFSKAEVIAVDINPIPPRPLPKNLTFMKLNLLKPLPFKKCSFDIIHARMVMMHLPQVEEVLQRVFDLLRPGGYIILEDPDNEDLNDEGIPRGPVGKEHLSTILNTLMQSLGAQPCIGRDHKKILESSGYFDDITVKKVCIPITPVEEAKKGSPEAKLGHSWKESWKTLAEALPARYSDQGLTKDVVNTFLTTIDDPNSHIVTALYFSWGRKKL